MATYSDHITYLATLDASIGSADRDRAIADLQWASYIKANRVKVAPFFAKLAKDATAKVWNRTPKTWESQASYAKTLLVHFGQGDLDAAIAAWDAENVQRVADGKRPVWSVQNRAKALTAKPKADETDADETAEGDETAAEGAESPKATPLEVILGLLPHLDAADLTAVAEAVSALRTVKAA